jgi:SEC-C motif-containing protein
MRSRYTAFVVGDAAHLRRSWHPRTRPDDLALHPATRWLGLEVLTVADGTETDDTGSVEFRARLIEGREPGELRERSRFVRRGGRWVYLDGAIGEGDAGA